jgi:hypothetical protein
LGSCDDAYTRDRVSPTREYYRKIIAVDSKEKNKPRATIILVDRFGEASVMDLPKMRGELRH